MKKLKYGLIGAGAIALKKYLPGYSKLKDDVEITAACDANGELLCAAADVYGIPLRFTDWRELLAQKDIDFVSVGVPNWLHAPITMEALRAGKHVHCEKPMAVNAALAQTMLDESRRCGKILMVGLNNRFAPWNRYVKELAASGELGEIYYAKCGWVRRHGLPHTGWFASKETSGGGALIDLGVHYIDLVLHFMGYPRPLRVAAATYNRFGAGENPSDFARVPVDYKGRFDVEDLAAGFIELENGASFNFEISWASHIREEMAYYELCGTKGGVRLSYPPEEEGGRPELTIFTHTHGRHVNIAPELPDRPDGSEFKEFVACIRNGTAPVTAPPEEAVAMMRLVEAIYQSAAEHRQVVL